MAYQVLRFKKDDQFYWGVINNTHVRVMSDFKSKNLVQFLEHNGSEMVLGNQYKSDREYELDDIEILCPITEPCSIVCQGKNYAEHSLEMGVAPKDRTFNMFFTKAASSLTSGYGPVEKPNGVSLLDYELELGVVIKQPINKPKNFHWDDLSSVIAGFVIANDISARDIQIPEDQWFHGKSFRTFCPVGPYLCVFDHNDFKRISELKLQLWVNDQLRQRALVSQMIYNIPETLTGLSQFMNLQRGDLLLTGTPSGVAMRIQKPIWSKVAKSFLPPHRIKQRLIESQVSSGRFLKPGDKVKATISTEDGKLNLGQQEFQIIQK